MSERPPLPIPKRMLERVEVDLTPFTHGWESEEDSLYEYGELVRRANVELGKRGVYLALTLRDEPVDVEAEVQAARRQGDGELIDLAIAEAKAKSAVISDAAARMIASQLHGGQGTDLYALASSGAIDAGALDELSGIADDDSFDDQARTWTKYLKSYVRYRMKTRTTDRVEGWEGLWLREDAPELESDWEREQHQTIAELRDDIRRRTLENEHDTQAIAQIERNMQLAQWGIKPRYEIVSATFRRVLLDEYDRRLSQAQGAEGDRRNLMPGFIEARTDRARLERIRAEVKALLDATLGEEES